MQKEFKGNGALDGDEVFSIEQAFELMEIALALGARGPCSTRKGLSSQKPASLLCPEQIVFGERCLPRSWNTYRISSQT